MSKLLIELKDIHKEYSLGDTVVPVLNGVSLEVNQGEYLALTGASGSGKSTLMNILGFLDQPSSGSYMLDGVDVSSLDKIARAKIRSNRIGFIFQSFNLLKRTTAVDNVMLALQYSSKFNCSRAELKNLAIEALKGVGLDGRLYHTPAQLSGGQQQRVAIARALVNQPSIVFADEPTGNLDTQSSKEILDTIRHINEIQSVTIIIVTHDPIVAKQAKRMIRMQDGSLTC